MAEEKKRKIDLKARLGKKSVATKGGASIPPPVGVPKQGAGGIPVPPFGAQKKAQVDPSDPYAALESDAAPARAEPQAIKVEMSEEVVQAQKKGRGRIIAGAVAAAAVGIGVGFSIGSGVERGKSADVALAGAEALEKEVDEATLQAEKLAEVLTQAKQKLSDNEYPEEEVKKLGGLRIPFQGANLYGKGIGRFKQDVITRLIAFTAGAEAANDQKDRVERVLSGGRKGVTEFLEQKKNPKVRWSVYVVRGPYGPWANMQPVPEPFPVKKEGKVKGEDGKEKNYEWPDEFEIKEGKKEYTLDRYEKGDPMGSEPDVIPVNPGTQDAVCSSDMLFKLRRELGKLEAALRGKKSAVPGQETKGLIDVGNKLVEDLKGIGQPG